MHIAVDALGGDNAPSEVVAGTVYAARKLPHVRFSLVGDGETVGRHLDGEQPQNVVLKQSGGAVSMDEEPAAALRARPDASIAVAAKMVREGDADALFSAGNTGATVAAALLGIGRLRNCRRPAIATFLPFSEPVILLDAGATISCRPQDLKNFAILGSVFSRRYFGLDREARVGVINVGEESGKGNDLSREAHALIRDFDGEGFEFVGNVEGRDIGTGVADVLVTDGFTGNVVLKTAEGTASALFGMIRTAVSESSPLVKLGGGLVRPGLRRIRDQVDPENYGGSFLLGVNGSVVIGHGNSMARGVENALVGIERTGAGLTEKLQEAIMSSQNPPKDDG